MRFDSRRRWVLLLAVVGAFGCLSPTLPLPPPNRPDVEGPDASGRVTLSGWVQPGAHVYADNLHTGLSAGQQADLSTGNYRFQIGAEVGDRLAFYYRIGTDVSQALEILIRGPNSAPEAQGGAAGSAGEAGSAAGGEAAGSAGR